MYLAVPIEIHHLAAQSMLILFGAVWAVWNAICFAR